MAEARQRWKENAPSLNPTKLVFIDETSAATNMTRRYGRTPRGNRLVDSIPHGHWKTTTFIAGLRCDALIAPAVFDGPMDGELFRAYVEQVLAPTLKPGDIVVMDNINFHKNVGAHQAIINAGAKPIFLPPYSPDFNPIEQLYAKLKALLRSASARTIDTLWSCIGELIGGFSESECRNYFHNSGYRFATPERKLL